MSIAVSAIIGWFLIIGLLFSIQDYAGTVASATGQPVTQILLDTVGEKGAIAMMVCTVTRWRNYSWNICTDFTKWTGGHIDMHVPLWRFFDHIKFSHDVCLLKRWCVTWIEVSSQGRSQDQDANTDG